MGAKRLQGANASFKIISTFKTLSGKNVLGFNLEMECGAVHASMDGWEYQPKQKGVNKKQEWGCKTCQGNWNRKNGGTRMVQIFGEHGCLELILDEPPQELVTKWEADRMKYYMKLEPSDARRNVRPKIFYHVVASDAIWAHIYNSSSEEACNAIDKTVEKQAAGLYGSTMR